MKQDFEDIRLAAAVLNVHLKDLLDQNAVPEDSETISEEDLIELAEGLLDATQREDLIARLAVNETDRARLSDLLVGYDHWETEQSAQTTQPVLPVALAALRDWVRETMDLLSPVLAYSGDTQQTVDLIEFARENNLLAKLDFEALDDSFIPRAKEIEDLEEAGLVSAQLYNVQAAVMEVHLVLSRDRGGAPEGFFEVWESVTDLAKAGSRNTWDDAYRAIREVYVSAIEMESDLAEAYVGIARIDLQLDDLDQAEENLQKAASLDPSEASAYHLLAQVRKRKQN